MAAEITFSAAIGIILGILGAGFGVGVTQFGVALVAIFLAVLIFKKGYVKFAAVSGFFCLLGFFYFFYSANMASQKYPEFNKKTKIEALAVAEPNIYENFQSIKVRLLAPYAGTVVLKTDPGRILAYGDKFVITGEFQQNSKIELPSIFTSDIDIAAERQGYWLKQSLLDFKNYIILKLKRNLSPASAALMSGLILGERSNFSADFKEAMKLSGTTHLVALSGYNISILAVVVAAVLGKFLKRRTTFFATVGLICLFVVMVGAEASVLRAAIMGVLMLAARETGRMYAPKNAIAVAAAAMAVLNPLSIFEVGFELSFVSLLGLVYLEPAIKKIFKIEPSSLIAQNALTTVSAQAMVLPLVMHYFGTFSLSSIFANALILWLVPLTMGAGFFLALSAIVFYPLAILLGFISEVLLRYQIFVIELFAKLRIPFGNFLNNFKFALIYYLVLALFISFSFYGKKE